jgi:hypothetical protein
MSSNAEPIIEAAMQNQLHGLANTYYRLLHSFPPYSLPSARPPAPPLALHVPSVGMA